MVFSSEIEKSPLQEGRVEKGGCELHLQAFGPG
jgi:hypothetical protein